MSSTTNQTPTNSNMERQPLEHSKVIALPIEASQIGMLVGAKGIFLKKFVFGPTMRGLNTDDDKKSDEKILFSVKEEDDKINGHLSASSESALSALEENVNKHVQATLNKIKRSDDIKTEQASGLSTFVFKATLPEEKIGDFIGRAGRNVNNIQCDINELDEVTQAKTNVSITKNRFVNSKNCHFHIMDMLPAVQEMKEDAEERGTDFETPYVIITVKTYTNNRRELWNKVHDKLKSELMKITAPRQQTGHYSTSVNSSYLDQTPTELDL
mgnify:CR=1 FL=1